MSNTTDESDKRIGAIDPPQNGGGYDEGTMHCGGRSGVRKRPWTPEEDEILKQYIRKYGNEKWDKVQEHYKLDRTGKSCRFRYVNHLDPTLKKGPFTPAEEQLIFQLHADFGNKWARMAKHLPGRTDNQIKNFWNTRNKEHKQTSLSRDPLVMSAQFYIENPSYEVFGRNPGFNLEGHKSYTSPSFYGGSSLLDSSHNIKQSQDLGLQSHGFNYPFSSSTQPQAHKICLPGPFFQNYSNDFSGKSIEAYVSNYARVADMISENVASTGGAIFVNNCSTNDNYSTFKTSLETEQVELPSFQCDDHDTDTNSLVSSPLKTIYPNIHSPIQWKNICFEEADNEFSDFSTDYFDTSLFNHEPMPQQSGMDIMLPTTQRENI